MPRRLSPLARALALVLVLLLALAGGTAALVSRQARQLGDALVADVLRLDAAVATHPGGREGNVLDCVGDQADLAPDVSRTLPWTQPALRAVQEGSAPTSTLPDVMRTALDVHEGWLAKTLGCAERSLVQPTPTIGPTPEPDHLRRQQLPRLQESLAALVPLRARLLLEAGQPEQALSLCAQALSLSADLLRAEAMQGMLGVLVTTRTLAPACAAAADAAPREAKLRFAEDVRRARESLPGFAATMDVERVQLELRLFSAWIPPDAAERLPTGALKVRRVALETVALRGAVANLAMRLYWRRFDLAMRRVQEAAALDDGPARERALRATERLFDAPILSRFFTSEPADVRFFPYAHEHEQLVDVYRLLETVARLDAGERFTPHERIEVSGSVVAPRDAELRRLAVTLHR